MRGWSKHALLRIKERYPTVLDSELEKVIPRIDIEFRWNFAQLDPAIKNGRVFVSIMLRTENYTDVKVKLIYCWITKCIVTVLPFKGDYDFQFPIRYGVRFPTQIKAASYWGA